MLSGSTTIESPLPNERFYSVLNSFLDRFGDARRAPRKLAKGLVLQTEVQIRSAAPIVIGECLSAQSRGFSAKEVLDASPQLSTVYVTANALGTALGDGVRGKGLGLYRDRTGRFLRSRTNAALAASRLSDDELTALAADLGFDDAAALIDAIDAPPDVTHDPLS
jgi:hypothetical protein